MERRPPPSMPSTQARKLRSYDRPQRDTGLWLLLLGAMVILGTAFALRDEHWLVPDRGAGYALGIVGLGAMAALLGYSVRKRLRLARRWGDVRTWFRVHMFLGLAGPVAILLHCNFSLGSTNANVALVSALAVSASGVVGRLLYGRIHSGLFGRRLSLLDLRASIAERRADLDEEAGSMAKPALDALERFERSALAPRGVLGGTARLCLLPVGRRRALREAAAFDPSGANGAVAREVRDYLRAVERVSIFMACERLFSLWHALHLPLCVALFGAAAVHVVAVHVY